MISLENKKYPTINSLIKNSYYCGILKNLYAGSEGECVVFLQLKYQIYILKNFRAEIACLLEEIVKTELLHQQLLANAILMSGGDPTYANSQNKWLGGRQIDYVKDIKQIISYDIEIKEKVVIDYKIAIAKIDNVEIKKLLASILQDEEIHLRKLKNIQKNF